MEERARCRRRQLSSKIPGLSRFLSISSILSLVLLVFPRPSKGSVWGSTQTHVGAGTRALLGPRVSASRRRALRGAAQGGADVVSRFPLLAPEARCGALRTPSESPCSACLTPYTQTCPACLPVLLCLLYVVLLFRMLGFLRAHQRASGASSGKRVTTPASATAAPSQRAAAERRCARSEQSSRACL